MNKKYNVNARLRAELEQHAIADLKARGTSRAVAIGQQSRGIFTIATALELRNGDIAVATMGGIKTRDPWLLVDAALDSPAQ